MMQTHFTDKEIFYDGSQLKGLFGYINFGLLGDSIVSFVGGCDVPFVNMVDGEDFREQSAIRGDKMLHFIIEKFDVDLYAGVALQRLFATLCIESLKKLSSKTEMTRDLRREGDDIFYLNKKLSISIATLSRNSVMIHFAMNVVGTGAPVEILCLQDLNVEPSVLAQDILSRFQIEADQIFQATRKVFGVD